MQLYESLWYMFMTPVLILVNGIFLKKIYLNGIKCFFVGCRLLCIIKILFFFYLWFFSEMLNFFVDNNSGLIGVVPDINKVSWIIEAYWIYFGLAT